MASPFNPASRYERELDRLITAIEAGGEWPPVDSEEHALLKRAMRRNPVDRKQWAVDRIAKCRPDKVTERREDLAQLIEQLVCSIEAGGHWPDAGTRERVLLLEMVNPKHRRFRKEIFDRIGARKPSGAPRRSAAETARLEAKILDELEATRIWPRASTLEGRLLRNWLRPEGTSFRRSAWERVLAIMPDRLDHQGFADIKREISALVDAIERGEPWPARRSAAGFTLARALDRHGAFFDQANWDRLQLAAPEAMARALARVGRPRKDRSPVP